MGLNSTKSIVLTSFYISWSPLLNLIPIHCDKVCNTSRTPSLVFIFLESVKIFDWDGFDKGYCYLLGWNSWCCFLVVPENLEQLGYLMSYPYATVVPWSPPENLEQLGYLMREFFPKTPLRKYSNLSTDNNNKNYLEDNTRCLA